MSSNRGKNRATAVNRPKRPRSLVRRLAVFYTLGATALLLVTMVILYRVLVEHMNADDTDFLADKLRAVGADLAEKKVVQGELLADDVPVGASDYFVRVLDQKTGQAIAERPEMPGRELPPSVFPAPPPDGQIPAQGIEYKTSDGKWFLLMSALAELHDRVTRRVVLQIAQDRSDDKAFTEFFRKLLLVVIAGGVAYSATVAVLGARRALRPLEEMAGVMEKVQASHLNPRVDREHWPIELNSLAAAFDQMLVRLEESFERLSRFSSDLAHELRNPIQYLCGEAEVALTRTRTIAEYQEVIQLSIEEYQRLARMIDSLLFLARAENAETRLNRITFEIGSQIDTILEFYEPAARENEVMLRREGDAEIYADPTLFRRVLSNLVSNALQHTASGGKIRVVVVAQNSEAVEIQVRDNGCGISPEHLPRIFDRFYRADPARSSDPGGTGLGLAIVKSIMDLHAGSISAESAVAVGTTVTLKFFPERQLATSTKTTDTITPRFFEARS